MIKLRRCLPGRDALRIRRTPLRRFLPAMLACVAVLATGSGGASTRSRTRHPVSAAVQPTFMAGPSARAPNRRKGKGGPASAPRQSSAPPRGSHGREKQSVHSHHGRSRIAEPVQDPIPMYRTEHKAGRDGQQLAQRGSGREPEALAWSRPARARAPRDSKAADSARWVEPSPSPSRKGNVATQRSWTADGRGGRDRYVAGDAGRSVRVSRRGAADRHSAPSAVTQAFAEGVSHPEGDERLPRQDVGDLEAGAVAAENSASVISAGSPSRFGVAIPAHAMSAADPTRVPNPYSQSQLVQGFGGEVALAAPAGSTRPGGTRRRNHLATFSAPDPVPTPTLDERDAITEAAIRPAVLPEIYDRDGRLLMPAPLKGSRVVLVHQNTMANNDGLERIRDDGDLERLRANGSLVNFPSDNSLRVSEDLPYNRRCARRWTVLFAVDIAGAFYDRFHQPIQVNSAVRTVAYQARLQRINGNAAATDGDAASPHLTGQAVDLAKRGMSSAQLAWMRAYLLPLMNAGKIDVEEEFHQACFHISVYRSYTAGRAPVHEVAQVRPADARTQDSPDSGETRDLR